MNEQTDGSHGVCPLVSIDKPRRKPKMKVAYGGEAEMVNNK